MAALANQKWELCALAYAGGNTQKEAYRAGGFKYDQSAASKFFHKPLIAARVQEIIAERHQLERVTSHKAAEEAGTDKAWVMRHLKHAVLIGLRGHPRYLRDGKRFLDENGNQIYGKPDIGPVVSALDLIGREQGMFITRTEVGGPGDFERMSDAELSKALIEVGQKLGLPVEAVKLLEWKEAAE